MLIYSQSLSERGISAGNAVADVLDKNGLALKKNLILKTGQISANIKGEAQDIWSEGKKSFLYGYLMLPRTLSKNYDNTNKAVAFKNYTEQFEKSENLRKEWSDNMSLLISNTISEYPTLTTDNFNKVKNERNNVNHSEASLIIQITKPDQVQTN